VSTSKWRTEAPLALRLCFLAPLRLIESNDAMATLGKIISGGQTGVDQAALRAAQKAGLPCGGWCPPGRACESGTIPREFPLKETPTDRSPSAPEVPRSLRTEWNVRDSDATLIFQPGSLDKPDAGTAWTAQCAADLKRPLLICDPWDPAAPGKVLEWLNGFSPRTLNVAGPSESACPGIGDQTFVLLCRVLSQLL
jgi:hypothetical protein